MSTCRTGLRSMIGCMSAGDCRIQLAKQHKEVGQGHGHCVVMWFDNQPVNLAQLIDLYGQTNPSSNPFGEQPTLSIDGQSRRNGCCSVQEIESMGEALLGLVGGLPQVGAPEVCVPNVGVPEVGVLEVGVPDVGVPEVGVPEVSVPEVGVPEVGVPEVGVPEVSVPEVSVLEVSVLEVSVPEVGVPEVGVLEVDAPEVDAPEVGVPEDGAPEVGYCRVSAGFADNQVYVSVGHWCGHG